MNQAIDTRGENLFGNSPENCASAVVLHISDLHFGWDGAPSQVVDRELCLQALVQVLRGLEETWKPTVICVTGDIGWRGAATDYQEAQKWLLELLGELQLPSSSLLLCPGNHDSDRKFALSNIRPSHREDAERVLQSPLAKQYLQPFVAFEEFCRNMGIPPYLFGSDESYVVGFRSVNGLNFVSLNSAWFSQGDDDKGRLWLGLPQIRLLEQAGQLPDSGSSKQVPTIALLHHPREWYHESEIAASMHGQPNTFDYLCHRAHVILTGHTHGEVRRADQYAEFAWHLSGGATYAGASHFNSFRLIKFESDSLTYRSFEFDPRASNAPWQAKGAARSLSLGGQPSTTPRDLSSSGDDMKSYQLALKAHAERLLVTKARSVTPFGSLPSPLSLSVVVHSAEVPLQFADHRLHRVKKQEVTTTFVQAISNSRRSLLLGDMGTGKSTLAARLAVEMLHTNRDILPILIEAKAIQFENQLTIAQLLELISNYANAQVFPSLRPISVQALLNMRTEILVIVDGLDEMPEGAPNELLRKLYELPDHWSNIHVVATGRPVELAGVSFKDWLVIHPAQLSDQDKLDLLRYEALAEGVSGEEATRTAEALYAKLKGTPLVNVAANTPLFVRLLYPRLSPLKAGEAITIGDLLYDLAKQRAGGWAKKDRKSPIAPLFEDSFPNPIFRIEILALLALALQSRDRMAKDEALVLLVDSFNSRGLSQETVLAEQALEFFSRAGLLLVETFVAFPSQSFLELFQGVGIATKWRLDENAGPLECDSWRVISFTCAVLRAQGILHLHRERITNYLANVLGSPAGVLPAAYIVAEAQDSNCAESFLSGLKSLPSHSLNVDWEAPSQSAQAIAIALKQAVGGFDWFYDQYLDPRYPFIHRGSGIVERIFFEWSALSRAHLSDKERAMLSAIVRPHIDASSQHLIHVLPILAALVPEAFTADERLWFRVSLLNNNSFRDVAISEIFSRHKSDPSLVNSLLLHLARDSSTLPATLWCELNPSQQPNPTIMRALMVSKVNRHTESGTLENHAAKLGSDNLLVFARWAVFDQHPAVAAGAAIALVENGITSFSIIGRPLLRAMHDGGYHQRAEEVLDHLIEHGGRTVVSELAGEIASTSDDMHGAHSGWWRLLLKHLRLAGDQAPELLGSAASGVGCFLLARHPEIRQAFRDLLASDDGHKFEAALRQRLYSVRPSLRHGAAMILLVVSPETEATALEVVVRSRSRQSHGSWHEWEEFLLTLSFGPSVLQHLYARYLRLDSHSQMLALAILARNAFSLTESEQKQLHTGLLDWKNWSLERGLYFERESSIRFFIEKMDVVNADLAARAATELMNRYSEDLSTQQLAKAALLSCGGNLRLLENERWLEKLESDRDFLKAVTDERELILKQGREEPLFALYCDALTNDAKWADIIWRLLLEPSSSGLSEPEEAGQWLLGQARKSDKFRASISSAAVAFLEDPRVCNNRWTDSIQWLAVIADECCPLPKDKLRDVLVRHPEPIRGAVAAALITRLGEKPENFRVRERVGGIPDFHSLQQKQHLFTDEDLINFARSSEKLHPDLCSAIESHLVCEAKTRQQMEQLAVVGTTGALLAVVFAYLYGVPPQLDWVIRHISLAEKFENDRDHCRDRLMECWRTGLRLANRDEVFKNSLIDQLHCALDGNDSNFFLLALSIFRLREGLTADEAIRVIAYYAAHRGYYDYGLIVHFCEWLVSSKLNKDECSIVISSLERTLVAMDGWSWEPEQYKRTCYPLLLFPVVLWHLSSSSNPSEISVQVFLKGLRHLFTPTKATNFGRRDEEDAVDVMSDVMNILAKAPKACLEAVSLAGVSSDDAIVRAISRFLSINSTQN